MFSLQALIGYRGRIFDVLDSSAANACHAARAANALANAYGHAASLSDFDTTRQRATELARETTRKLMHSFTLALDREDVEAINSALYDIPKTIDRFARRYSIVAKNVQAIDFARHTALLVRCAEIDADMIRNLRQRGKIARISELNDQLRVLESQSDELLAKPYGDLYLNAPDAKLVLFIKDLFEILEKAIDQCRAVGQAVYAAALKNS